MSRPVRPCSPEPPRSAIHRLPVEDALRALGSSAEGLSSAEARRRLAELGPNAVARIPGEPLWRRLRSSFANFFALILWLAAALAFLAESQQPGEGMATLGLAILGVVGVNGAFSFWQEHRAERAIAELEKLLPHRVQVARDGRTVEIGAAELVPGDVALVEEGEDVAADCRVLEAVGLRVSNATLTGESAPAARDERPSGAEALPAAGNVLLAGTSIVSGRGRALVFETGMRTELGRIAALSQAPREALSPLQREIVHLSQKLAALAVGLGAAFFGIGVAIGLPFWDNLLFGIGIIVANVPEGLLPTVTLALAMGSQRMARRSVLIRHLPSVETLGAATVICTD
ncbi:MAG: cation-transporting P-type ATPase, partial [Polyangiaceae bacterium]|nr:cation-transporting P-type ATPase [Polyangiaceae bacterium]